MVSRRRFIFRMAAVTASPLLVSSKTFINNLSFPQSKPIFITTWNNIEATKVALDHILLHQNDLLTAIEKGINLIESDPDDISVGLGGLPDSNGEVTLDACMMDHEGNAGSVTYLKNIMNPVSVARLVMETTPFVMLSGKGAYKFALKNGFKKTNLLTRKAKKQYKKWLKTKVFSPVVNIENHDTIGMLGKDIDNNISGACSSSGLAFKLPGRVGDSPIIGSGLYVDNEIGAAAATGLGELVLRQCSSFLIVELMRQGYPPREACKEAVCRIVKHEDVNDVQVGLIAINKEGLTGGFSIRKGFNYALSLENTVRLVESDSYFD